MYFPSAAMEREFLSQASPLSTRESIVEPRRFLGRIGSKARADLTTKEHIHPALTYRQDVKNNYLTPHNRESGPLTASRHDIDFHALHATMLPPLTRTALCQVLPNFLVKEMQPENRVEKEAVEELIEKLTDLSSKQQQDNKFFPEKVLSTSCRSMLSNMRISPEGEARKKDVDNAKFFLKLLQTITTHEFPEPYSRPENMKVKYEAAFSRKWEYLTVAIIEELGEYVDSGIGNKYAINADEKKFIAELMGYASASDIGQLRYLVEKMEAHPDPDIQALAKKYLIDTNK